METKSTRTWLGLSTVISRLSWIDQERSKSTAWEINSFTLHDPSIKTQLEFVYKESALYG